MRLCLGLVVAAALSLEMVQALLCYTCNTASPSSECNQKTNCSALSLKFAACKTTIMSEEAGFPFMGKEVVFRQCVEMCTPTGQNWLGITRKILCCNLDYCNGNGIQDAADDSTSIGSPDNCPKDHGQNTELSPITIILLVLSAIIYPIH